jgi:hypothetical protein
MNRSRKNGAPQLTCNNNYAKVIAQILPEDQPLSNSQAPLKDWLPLAKTPEIWQKCIDNYFESCCFIDPEDDCSVSSTDSFPDTDKLSLCAQFSLKTCAEP